MYPKTKTEKLDTIKEWLKGRYGRQRTLAGILKVTDQSIYNWFIKQKTSPPPDVMANIDEAMARISKLHNSDLHQRGS